VHDEDAGSEAACGKADRAAAAQQRAETSLNDEELQARAGAEARRLRHFIPG
jgi:hypothetical protein